MKHNGRGCSARNRVAPCPAGGTVGSGKTLVDQLISLVRRCEKGRKIVFRNLLASSLSNLANRLLAEV